jgi:undecaprenyl pyrophosphate phosphatase UppP
LIYGLLSAVLFAVPLSLAFRRERFSYGVLFVVTFVVAAVGGMVLVGGAANIPLLFSLPDTWALIVGSLTLFWLMNKRQQTDLPSNSTFERDARKGSARPST